jgi:hypothetical protein
MIFLKFKDTATIKNGTMAKNKVSSITYSNQNKKMPHIIDIEIETKVR